MQNYCLKKGVEILEDKIRIRMLKTVRADMPFLAKPGTIARKGQDYNAMTNRFGAISAICENGEILGVKPGEFEFTEAPDWLLKIHKQELAV